jgi:hypothetical protein
MNSLDVFRPFSGSWRGLNVLIEPPENIVVESPGTAQITPILKGKFLRMDYTWDWHGSPEEGSLLLGYQEKEDLTTVHWIDTWHNGNAVLELKGAGASENEINVLGKYSSPGWGEWGWRIRLQIQTGGELKMIHYNISPEGEEFLAVETSYHRE